MRKAEWLPFAVCAVALGSCLRREILAEAEPSTLATPTKLPDESLTRGWLECHRTPPLAVDQHLALPDVIVEPLAYGPRFTRLPEAIHQDPTTIEEALRETLHDCYRWAHRRDPELDGIVHGTILIDPFSRVETAQFTANESQRPSHIAVARCFSDVLRGRELSTKRNDGAWWTWVPIEVEMKPAPRQPRDATYDAIVRRPRPDEPTPPKGACVQHGAPIDRLDTIRISLADPAMALEPSGSVTIRPRWSAVQRELAKRVASNLGAYRECWRRALETGPVSPGVRDFALTYDQTGNAQTGDDARGQSRDQCLLDALHAVRMPPGIAPFRAHVRLVLTPPTTAATVARPVYATVNDVAWLAERTLAIGDGARAERHLAALLLEQPNECRWRALRLPAVLASDPLADARFGAAIDQLAQVQYDDACLALARPALDAWMDGDPQRQYRVATALPRLPEQRALLGRAADTWAGSRNYEDVCRAAAIHFDLALVDSAMGNASASVERAVISAQRCVARLGGRHVCHGFPSRAPARAEVQRLFDATELLLRSAPMTAERARLVLATLERRAESEGQLAEVIATLVPFAATAIARNADPGVTSSALDLLVHIHRLGTFE